MAPLRTKVDRFGRVVLPKPVRADLGLRAGTVLTVESRGEGVFLKPARTDPAVVQKKGLWVVAAPVPGVEDVLGDLREERTKNLLGAQGAKAGPK